MSTLYINFLLAHTFSRKLILTQFSETKSQMLSNAYCLFTLEYSETWGLPPMTYTLGHG